MRVCFIGTGGSWPTKRRNPISIAVTSGKTNILLDCGEGTQRQILFTPLSPNKLDAILISHLHGDHFLGLPGLVQTMSLNDRSKELMIYGPEGIVGAFEKAMTMCSFNPGFEMNVITVREGDSFKVGEINFLASKADHTIPSLAFRVFQDQRPGRFSRKTALELGIPEGPLWGRLQKGESVSVTTKGVKMIVTPDMVMGPPREGYSLGYTGDTCPNHSIVELMKGVDMLIHEATFSSELEEKASEYKHSTARQAAITAREAKARTLYLVHSSPRYSREGQDEILLKEAMEVFDNVSMPEDLDCVELSR